MTTQHTYAPVQNDPCNNKPHHTYANTHTFVDYVESVFLFSLPPLISCVFSACLVSQGETMCLCQDGCCCGIKISSIQTRSPTPSRNKLCLLWVENKPVFICGVWGGKGVKCGDCEDREVGWAKGLYLPVCHNICAICHLIYETLNIYMNICIK